MCESGLTNTYAVYAAADGVTDIDPTCNSPLEKHVIKEDDGTSNFEYTVENHRHSYS